MGMPAAHILGTSGRDGEATAGHIGQRPPPRNRKAHLHAYRMFCTD